MVVISTDTSWLKQQFKSIYKSRGEFWEWICEGREEKAVLHKGQSTSAVLQLNLGPIAAAFITETFLVTPDLYCAISTSTYLFHFVWASL